LHGGVSVQLAPSVFKLQLRRFTREDVRQAGVPRARKRGLAWLGRVIQEPVSSRAAQAAMQLRLLRLAIAASLSRGEDNRKMRENSVLGTL
jgi:hypothetical protein